MLSREEKARTFETYIASKKFGRDTWTTIHVFGHNVVHGINLLQLLFVLMDRLDRNDIEISSSSEHNIIRIKQQIYLEIILKLETLIESTFVLVASLGKGYTKLTRNMTYYDIKFVKDVTRKFAHKNKCDINLRRALGLANPAKLQLTSEERKLLLRIYEETINHIKENLYTLANFYERYRIVYGKTKHGLTIQTGLSFYDNSNLQIPTNKIQFNKSHLVCYDQKARAGMPVGTLEMSSTDIGVGDYYNVLTYLNFNEKLETEIKQIMKALQNLVKYVCENHMIHATNCGENYLPYSRDKNTPNEYKVKFFSNPSMFTQEETKSLYVIFERIMRCMSLINLGTVVSADYHIPDSTTRQSITNDSVVNIWLSRN